MGGRTVLIVPATVPDAQAKHVDRAEPARPQVVVAVPSTVPAPQVTPYGSAPASPTARTARTARLSAT